MHLVRQILRVAKKDDPKISARISARVYQQCRGMSIFKDINVDDIRGYVDVMCVIASLS